MPCLILLTPNDQQAMNANGVSLVYKPQLNPPSFARTSASIHAVHLPPPSTYGAFDRYEGFATIPSEISWRFALYPTAENESPTWAGRFDYISAELKRVVFQVRPSNTTSLKLGSPVLQSSIQTCESD